MIATARNHGSYHTVSTAFFEYPSFSRSGYAAYKNLQTSHPFSPPPTEAEQAARALDNSSGNPASDVRFLR